MKMRTLGPFVLALLVAAACGTEGGDGTTTVATDEVTTTADQGDEPATTTTEAMDTTTSEAMDTTSSAAAGMDGVHTAESDLGTILVDPEGFTLYIFTVDVEGESACYDDCAATWPPVPADTPISSDLDQSMFGSIERTDDIEQLTVNGMPLYRYAPDANPGDTTGQGVGDVWFVVDAEGNMIEASAADEEDVASDYDY
jgi:predicted lipoprotein with Yx(FWY)xxD motif